MVQREKEHMFTFCKAAHSQTHQWAAREIKSRLFLMFDDLPDARLPDLLLLAAEVQYFKAAECRRHNLLMRLSPRCRKNRTEDFMTAENLIHAQLKRSQI